MKIKRISTRSDKVFGSTIDSILSDRNENFASFDLGNLLSHKIVSIEGFGEACTYDIEVEDTHTFFTEGIYSSNSRRGK